MKKDMRYILCKERMESLSNEELQRIIDNEDIMCYDTYNFDGFNKLYCPIAIAMNLHNTIDNPTDELVKAKIGERFQPSNIFKGTPGDFYTTNRKEDILGMCRDILNKREANE